MSASLFPLATLRSHPAEYFHIPGLMRPCQRESRNLLGSPGIYTPEWCITRLIYVKLCRDNSLPRQPTNPFDYVFGVRHPNWLLLAVQHEGDSHLFAHIFHSGRGFISYCWERMDRSLLTLMQRHWLLGFWNKYLIFKDHFVACNHQPSQVFSVCLWFPPYDSINSARETRAQLSLKASPNIAAGFAPQTAVYALNSVCRYQNFHPHV